MFDTFHIFVRHLKLKLEFQRKKLLLYGSRRRVESMRVKEEIYDFYGNHMWK